MFVGDEVLLDVSFAAASGRLANLAHDSLLTASQDAYDAGATGLVWLGPLGWVPGASKLVQVHVHELPGTADSAGVALRWEATGPGGRLLPALDADLRLTAAGEHATLLTVSGVYRPPLGTLGARLDRAILRRVAASTVRTFINRVADAITRPSTAAPAPAAGASPASPPSALETS